MKVVALRTALPLSSGYARFHLLSLLYGLRARTGDLSDKIEVVPRFL